MIEGGAPGRDASPRRPSAEWIQATVILSLTFLAYWPAIHGGFLWDDGVMLSDNPLIKAANGLRGIWLGTTTPDYFPLTSTMFWLEWRLWGMNTTGYHAVNILLHALNAILLWRVFLALEIPGAWFAGLLFTLHPVNVASVAWIAEGKNTLSMLFYLGALLSWLRSDGKGRGCWLALLLFLLALLAKSSVVMLPVILLLCAWWKRGKITPPNAVRTVPFFVLSLALSMVTIWFQRHRAIQEASIPLGGFASRLASAGWAAWFYLWKALVPLNLTMVYRRWPVGYSSILWCVPSVALVCLLALLCRRRETWGRATLFALAYFLISLFPIIGFFSMYYFVYAPVADQWQYLALPGMIGLVAAGLEQLRSKLGAAPTTAVQFTLLALLSTLTWRQSATYSSNEALWQATIQKNPDSWVARSNLGLILVTQGKVQEGMRQFREAIRINPNSPDAHLNLGIQLDKTGHLDDAITELRKAVGVDANFAQAHLNLGILLDKKGRPDEAIGEYQEALKLRPQYADAENDWAAILDRYGRSDEAIFHYEQAIRINPDFAEAHLSLGAALYKRRRLDEAIHELREVIRLRPDSADAYNNLGSTLYLKGRIDEAIPQFRHALKLDPNHAGARQNLNAMLRIRAAR